MPYKQCFYLEVLYLFFNTFQKLSGYKRNSVNNLVDYYYGRINCYNSSKYLDIVIKYAKYIDNYLNNEKVDETFELIIKFLEIIDNICVDNEDDYYQGVAEIEFYLDKLIDEYDYQDIIIEYMLNNYKEKEITPTSVGIIHRLISNIVTLEEARKIINLIENIQNDSYLGIELVEDMITLTHDYIGLSEAIKLANKHRDKYRIKIKTIELIEETGDDNKLIKELKRQIKESGNLELYEKLLSIYLKNDKKEAENLLFEMIKKFNRIEHYKKLKSIVCKTKMKEYCKIIINSISQNSFRKSFLLEIYEEDNVVDKLFKEIRKSDDLNLLSSYKKIINDNYHDELLDYYKELIIKQGSKCYGRSEYYNLCHYIKELYSLNCPKDFVINLVKEMYSFYKTKKAFREEIMNVLNNDDKIIFKNLTSSLK